MATKVVMEALSPTMEEGRLVEWKKREGDPVAVGEVLAEVETDKAVMELVARAGGTLLKQLVAAGATVPVSTPVGWIGQAGESVDGGPEGGQAVKQSGGQVERAPGPEPSAATEAVATARPPDRPTVLPSDRPIAMPQPSDRVKASPLARKIASERGVDLTAVSGSGPEGRVVKRDLEAGGQAVRRPGGPEAPRPPDRSTARPPYEDVPLSQLRKTIAKRLVQSIGPIPTFYLTSEVDMERVAEAREALNASLGEQGKVSFNDIVLKAVATALRQHPACNAWWQDDHLRVWHEVHLGMAVAIEDGLITPVLRNADTKSLRELSAESRELAKRARERKLKPEEYVGSTFSVSNLGMFDIEHFTAIINPPEAAILAVRSIAPLPPKLPGQLSVLRHIRMTL